jgi:hypothetical protein
MSFSSSVYLTIPMSAISTIVVVGHVVNALPSNDLTDASQIL